MKRNKLEKIFYRVSIYVYTLVSVFMYGLYFRSNFYISLIFWYIIIFILIKLLTGYNDK